MIVDLKIILILNMVGLAASFLARRIFKGKPFAEFIPYGFLYLTAILCLQAVMHSNKESTNVVENTAQPAKEFVSEDFVPGSVSENEYIRHEISYSAKAVSIKPVLKAFSGANTLEDSKLLFTVLGADDKPFDWNKSDAKDFNASVSSKTEEYLNELAFTASNNDSVAKKIRFVMYIKPGNGSGLAYDRSNTVRKLVALTSNHWLNMVGFDFDKIEEVSDGYFRATKEIELAPKESKTIPVRFLTAPNQISKIASYEKFFGAGLEDFVYPTNILTKAVSNILYKPLVIAFEFLTKVLLSPVLAFIAILIVFKILTLPLNYQGHGFSQEFQRIISMATATKNQDAIRDAIMNNKNLDIKNKIISVVLKLVFFFVFWRVINNSPLFYGQSLLWIKNLAVRDAIGLNNLFGFSKEIPYLPYVGLAPLLTMGLLFFEIQEKNKNMESKQSQTTLLIMLAFFLYGINNMPAIFCVYLICNNVIDTLQSYIFSILKKRPKARTRTIKNT